ncbi:carboxymethylenebutenolidase homolog [Pelodytes ibericus]
MANETQPCPFDLGDEFDCKGLGQEVQIDHIKAYVCKPKLPSDKAVIVVHDIFGWELPNTRLFVDLLASHGYIAVLADFYVAKDPWQDTNDASTLFDWLETRPPNKVDKEVNAVLKYLEDKCHAKKIGVIGFCWGGIVTRYLMVNYPKLKAGVAFYGLVREQDVDKYDLLIPALFIFGENDSLIPIQEVSSLEQKFKEHTKVDYKVKIFPKQSHGFAHRKKEEIDHEDEPFIEEARKDMLLWLNKYIA